MITTKFENPHEQWLVETQAASLLGLASALEREGVYVLAAQRLYAAGNLLLAELAD